MTNEVEYPPVRISLKRSSSKDGQEGWDIDVTSAATDDDVVSAVEKAIAARLAVRKALGIVDPADLMERQLEASIASKAAEGA